MIPQPSPWLKSFLKIYEKFRPTAYKPTRKDVWTAGWGHTEGVTQDTTCTVLVGEQWLDSDIAKRAVAPVQQHITASLNQNQADAVYSLVFNTGPAPLLKTLGAKLNAGDMAGAAAEFPKWDYQAGVQLPGLENRRVAEQAHFLMPVVTS